MIGDSVPEEEIDGRRNNASADVMGSVLVMHCSGIGDGDLGRDLARALDVASCTGIEIPSMSTRWSGLEVKTSRGIVVPSASIESLSKKGKLHQHMVGMCSCCGQFIKEAQLSELPKGGCTSPCVAVRSRSISRR